MEKGNNRLVFKRIDDETRYYDIINIFLEYYYFRINESSIFVKESVYNFITTNILHEMYVCRWKSRGEIINRGWMELVFLDSQWSNLATCTTRVSMDVHEERMSRIVGSRSKGRILISIWTRACSFETCRLSIKRRILPGLWCLDARLIKFVDPLHGQILRDTVKFVNRWRGSEGMMQVWNKKEEKDDGRKGRKDYGRWLCFRDKGSLIDGGFFEVFFFLFFFVYFSGQALFENFSVLRFERLRVI